MQIAALISRKMHPEGKELNESCCDLQKKKCDHFGDQSDNNPSIAPTLNRKVESHHAEEEYNDHLDGRNDVEQGESESNVEVESCEFGENPTST